jgi:hypothetical protein
MATQNRPLQKTQPFNARTVTASARQPTASTTPVRPRSAIRPAGTIKASASQTATRKIHSASAGSRTVSPVTAKPISSQVAGDADQQIAALRSQLDTEKTAHQTEVQAHARTKGQLDQSQLQLKLAQDQLTAVNAQLAKMRKDLSTVPETASPAPAAAPTKA